MPQEIKKKKVEWLDKLDIPVQFFRLVPVSFENVKILPMWTEKIGLVGFLVSLDSKFSTNFFLFSVIFLVIFFIENWTNRLPNWKQLFSCWSEPNLLVELNQNRTFLFGLAGSVRFG